MSGTVLYAQCRFFKHYYLILLITPIIRSYLIIVILLVTPII